MAALPDTSKRRSNPRKRLSALRLSTDTTAPLPAYSAPPRPDQASHWPTNPLPPLDQPPDYPQSAEEADKEEDDFVPPRLPRNPVHRRLRRHRTSSSISSTVHTPSPTSVDDLLERSVVALELSTNALLQSMNTQSSISAIANDQLLERSLDRQTKMLDLRLKGNTTTHNGWMEDLDDVMKSVDGLFLDSSGAAISRSLPDRTHMHSSRRPKLPTSSSDSAYFHLTTSSEVDLRNTIRPPRALTQYVSVESNLGDVSDATANPDSILLPSTLGLRAATQVQTLSIDSPPQQRIRKMVSSPGPDCSNIPMSAYNVLSNLASGRSSRSPSRTGTPSTSDSRSRRTLRRYSAGSADSNLSRRPPSQSRSSASSTEPPPPPPPPPVRAMTPPMEESPPSSSDSSPEDNKVKAFRAMQSLRKILDDAPSPSPDPKGKRRAVPERRGFQPRSPAVAPSAGESTATASVYRLFTRSSHHHASSTRPKQSSLKRSARLLTPVSPGTPSASSGHSTPRQVSFAELPADHPGRPRSKGKGRRKTGKEKEKEVGGWIGWFTPSGSAMGSAAGVYEERMEDKMMRGWGRPAMTGGNAADDWML